MLPLGVWGQSNGPYEDARALRVREQQLTGQGEAYEVATQQLLDYYDQSTKAIALYADANTTTQAGLKESAAAYRKVISIRQKIVTSALLADENKVMIDTLSDIANLYDQKAAALLSNNLAAINGINNDFAKDGLELQYLDDSPKGFTGWYAALPMALSSLVADSK